MGPSAFGIEPEFAVKIDADLGVLGVLLEPTSIVAKAWDHAEGIGRRARVWTPSTVLVTGAGSIGLLAAMMGVQRGLETHVLDHNENGSKRAPSEGLGARFHVGTISDLDGFEPDILMECTGVPSVICDVLGAIAPAGIVCLLGSRSPGTSVSSTSASSTAPWCSRTTRSSARSMPIARTTRWRWTRSLTPTRAGSRG